MIVQSRGFDAAQNSNFELEAVYTQRTLFLYNAPMINLNTTPTLPIGPSTAPKTARIAHEATAILNMMSELGVSGLEKTEVDTMLEVWSRFFKLDGPQPEIKPRLEPFNADDFIRALDSKDEQSFYYQDYKKMIESLETVNGHLHGYLSTLFSNGLGLRAALWAFRKYMDWKFWHSGFDGITDEEYAIAWKVLPTFTDAALKTEGNAVIPQSRYKLLALINTLGHHNETARLAAYKEMMLYLQQPEVKERMRSLRPFLSQVICDSLGITC
jgi:hypothetical protein